MLDPTGIAQNPPNKLGKYEIRRLLGKGNMGMVFLAHDSVLERDVAVKIMAGNANLDGELRVRFEREAKAVARLQHPHIVTIHDLGYSHDGSPFIAMELLEGEDLEELVKKKTLSPRRSLEIVAQVCRGLHQAHSSGIVHRDVKPANVFVTKDGAKIMDFGVARWTQSSQTQTGAVLGTARYMSPEQIRGERVDGRSDIFSLGVVLYELLTNERLFEGENIETVFFRTLTQDPPQLETNDGAEYPELQRIISTSLAAESENRYADAEKMAEAIESLLRNQESPLPEQSVFRARGAGPSPRSGSLRQLNDDGSKTRALSSPSETALHRAARPQSGRGVSAVGIRNRPAAPNPSRGRVSKKARTRPWAAALGLVFAVLSIGSIGYWLIISAQESIPDTPAPSSADVDLEGRFLFAEGLLETGQIAQAFEVVQNILAIDPENARALALQAEVQRAAQSEPPDFGKAPDATNETPVPSDEVPATPTPREHAATLAADAALALGNGQLGEARSLISRGRKLDPANSRWSRLDGQLRAARAAAELKASAGQYIQEGRQALETGDYRRAIDAYKAAIEYTPESQDAQNGLEQAIRLERDADAERRTAIASARNFIESETAYIPSKSDKEQTEEVVGFQMEERFQVNETTEATFPAGIIIEIHPADAKPSEPYVLRVRVFNKGYRPIDVRSLELVSRFGGQAVGKGVQIPTRTQRIEPQATALVHEISGTWKESQQSGDLTATILLADGGKFKKSISW